MAALWEGMVGGKGMGVYQERLTKKEDRDKKIMIYFSISDQGR